ncbi:hypothetical protein D3C86_2110420 [compost metagenome]
MTEQHISIIHTRTKNELNIREQEEYHRLYNGKQRLRAFIAVAIQNGPYRNKIRQENNGLANSTQTNEARTG